MKANSEAKERVLDTAERMFGDRGYNNVSLREIADELGMQHASLYYHVPKGKEALFVEVTERSLHRHMHSLTDVLAETDDDLGSQLQAVSRYLLAQPTLNFGRMIQSDMPAISEENADYLQGIAYQSLFGPIMSIFRLAMQDSEENQAKAGILAGSFLSVIDGIHTLPERFGNIPKQTMADTVIEVFARGVRASEE